MTDKVVLSGNISRNTADNLNRYLSAFAGGTHRLYWVEDRAYVEFDRTSDAEIICREFPMLVEENVSYTGVRSPDEI